MVIGKRRQAVTGIQEEAGRLASQRVGKCRHEVGRRIQEVIDADTQAGMDKSGDCQAKGDKTSWQWQAQRDRLADSPQAGMRRQAVKQAVEVREKEASRQTSSQVDSYGGKQGGKHWQAATQR
jgi:hypothetical protein